MGSMMNAQQKKEIRKLFGDEAKFDEVLAPYTTFQVGGPADVFIVVKDIDRAGKVLAYAKKNDIPLFILGGGSNILVSDKGYRGIVLKNELSSIEIKGISVHCQSGLPLKDLLEFARDNSLSNLEFMSGIYGTVGGAVFGNAGAYGNSIGDFIQYVEVLDSDGKLLKYDPGDLVFSYRKLEIPSLPKKETALICGCEIKFKKGDSTAIAGRMDEIIRERDGKMPQPVPSAGCFFKNVECSGRNGKISAGMLLDQVISGSQEKVGVHPKHANILMNKAGASAGEILSYAEKLKDEVRNKHGIELEFEVKLVGEF